MLIRTSLPSPSLQHHITGAENHLPDHDPEFFRNPIRIQRIQRGHIFTNWKNRIAEQPRSPFWIAPQTLAIRSGNQIPEEQGYNPSGTRIVIRPRRIQTLGSWTIKAAGTGAEAATGAAGSAGKVVTETMLTTTVTTSRTSVLQKFNDLFNKLRGSLTTKYGVLIGGGIALVGATFFAIRALLRDDTIVPGIPNSLILLLIGGGYAGYRAYQNKPLLPTRKR
ncbi:MAG: hypothetical protein RMK43_12865 [Cyclobacteriaceae bacterium]|nr:hypothetical protein [Cyclobacteriaceae bacterium]